MRAFVFMSVAALQALPAPGRAAGVEAPDVAAFARHALASDPDVSPRGTWFAAVRQEGRKRSLVFTNVATGKVESTWTPPGDTTVGTFSWANEERVVVELADLEGDFMTPVSRGEIYAVDVKGRGGRLVFGWRAGDRGFATHLRGAEPELAWGQVIDPLRYDDRRVLVAARSMREVGDRSARLYKLDVYSGAKTYVTRSPMPEADFLTDENGELRVAFGFDEKVRMRIHYREAGSNWRELPAGKWFGADADPVAFTARDRTLLVAEPLGDGFGIFSIAVDGGERKLLTRTRVAPPRTAIVDWATGRLVAVESEPDLPAYEFVDPDHPLSRSLRRLLAEHPGEHLRVVARSDDQRKAVVLQYSDRDPGRYLVVDVETAAAVPVAEVRPWIRPEDMSRTTPFHMSAGDGFRIHGYLTSPRVARLGSPPPLVVLLHGGPHGSRDVWGFDPKVQLLASRGFAVLQVNYRGSGGYGRAYLEAGYRKWGDRVVEDVLDATRRAVREGQADPRRICTWGASFGAYAAVQAAVLAPDLIRCAVGDAGIYDLARAGDADAIVESRLGRGFLETAVGDDPAALRSASPVYHADRLKARVLLVHGKRDRRAPIEQAERLRDALAARGNPAEWLVEPNEGHGFYDEPARERMYARLVAFLEESTR